jgi:hypothetical protein
MIPSLVHVQDFSKCPSGTIYKLADGFFATTHLFCRLVKRETMHVPQDNGVPLILRQLNDGLDWPALIRLLRKVFSLSFTEAKEVTVISEGLAPSLKEHQEKFVPTLTRLHDARSKQNNSKPKKPKKRSEVPSSD